MMTKNVTLRFSVEAAFSFVTSETKIRKTEPISLILEDNFTKLDPKSSFILGT